VFDPAGRRVLTGSVDGTVRTYRCTLCGRLPELQADATSRLRRLDRASGN
jgi:hypothetical protein